MEGKKLYKSNVDKKIDGVCAGIGQYFNIDPTIIRLISERFCIVIYLIQQCIW